MQIPKKVYLIGYDVVSMKLTMPNGKKFILKRGDVITTSNPEELDFFSKQKGLMIVDIDIKELRKYIAQVNIPVIENTLITPETADKFKWNTEEEAMVIQKLKDAGYIITTSKEEEAIPVPLKVEKPEIVLEPKPKVKVAKNTRKVATPKKKAARRRVTKK